MKCHWQPKYVIPDDGLPTGYAVVKPVGRFEQGLGKATALFDVLTRTAHSLPILKELWRIANNGRWWSAKRREMLATLHISSALEFFSGCGGR